MEYKENYDGFSKEEMDEVYLALGLDPETVQGDYSESFQHTSHKWKQVEIDNRFFRD